MRNEPEKLIQESFVQYLGLEQRVPFIHIYYPRSMLEGKRAKRMGLAAGWPDLLLPAPGSLCLEIKAPGGRQSAIQRARQLELESYGLIYKTGHSLDELRELAQAHCPWGYA